MSTVAQPFLTPEEYLAIDRRAERRSEYFNGMIFAMAGASRRHNLIVINVGGELRARLKGRPCEVYVSDMRVKVSATGLYTYPDLAALCEEPRFEDGKMDTLLNPSVLVEVLSESTEAYDRGDKFAQYRRIESLAEYVLIAQDRVRVERYTRQGNQWLLSEISDPDDALPLPSLGCEVPLSEIYARVAFGETEEGAASGR